MTAKEEKDLLNTVKQLVKDNKAMKTDLDMARRERKHLNSKVIKQAGDIRGLKATVQALSRSR